MDLEQKNNDGLTPLNEAVFHGKLSIVKYLAGERNADMGTTDNDGRNLLHVAVLRSHFYTMKYLLDDMKLLSRIDERDNRKCTVTMMAARCAKEYRNSKTHSSHAILKYLLEEKHVISRPPCSESCRDFK